MSGLFLAYFLSYFIFRQENEFTLEQYHSYVKYLKINSMSRLENISQFLLVSLVLEIKQKKKISMNKWIVNRDQCVYTSCYW